MAQTVEELVVAARPENLDETTEGLEDMENSFGEVGDQMGEVTGDLEGLQTRFQGAMAAILGGLSAAVVGLLSKVPVVQEVGSALGGTFTALTMQIDKDLRPSLNKLVSDIIGVNEEMYEADSASGAFRTALDGIDQAFNDFTTRGIQSKIKDLTGITIPKNWLDLGLNALTMDWDDFLESLKSSARNLGPDVATLISGWFPQWGQKLRTGWNNQEEFWDTTIANIVGKFSTLPEDVNEWWEKTSDKVSDTANDLVDDALTWGEGLLDSFSDGLDGLEDAVKEKFRNALNGAIDIVNTGVDKLPGSIQSELGVSGGIGQISRSEAGLGDSDSGGNNSRGFRARTGGERPIFLGGRRVDQQLGRYTADRTTRRGVD